MGEAINLVENFKVGKVIFNCGEFNELEKDLIKVLDKKKIPYYSYIKELNIDDKWLMNHYYVCKFSSIDCIDCINCVIDIAEASFDKERLKQYILSSNNDIDKLNIFSKICFYNYKITNQKELDKIFNDCLEYIFKYINEKVKGIRV